MASTLRTVLSGWPGAKASLEGAGLALVLLLPLVLMRALGAGDWKLMGAVGAFLGPVMFLFVLLGSILVSGLMAMVEMMRTRRVKETFHNLYVLVQGFLSFGLRPNPEISLDNPDAAEAAVRRGRGDFDGGLLLRGPVGSLKRGPGAFGRFGVLRRGD